jgi:hypothetical protein
MKELIKDFGPENYDAVVSILSINIKINIL